jgi:lathosterol oxidase
MGKFRDLLNQPEQIFQVSLGITAEVGVRYLLFAGIAWLLGYVLFRQRWAHRKIILRPPQGSDIRRELSFSLLTVCIFGLIGTATLVANAHGWGQMYWKPAERGWPWFWLSIVVAIVIHDTYFYWTHRLMHHPRIFRWMHRVHHESTNPSPWTSYSFAPAEAVVQAGIFPVVTLLIPIHPLAFGFFMLWQITFNVLGHTGYEYHPKGFVKSRWGWWLNTPTNHIQHHEKFRGNYGLYFNYWDRLMGTNHPDYEDRFQQVAQRPRDPASPAS